MRTAIYVRVSTDRQTQAQTIDQQVERLQRHLSAQGKSSEQRTFSAMTGIVEQR